MIGNTIPGPREFPFVGSVAPLARDPLAFLTGLVRDHGEMVRFRVFGQPIVLVANPDAVRELLVEKADAFPKGPRSMNALGKFLGHGLLTIEGPFHRSQRKLMQPAFHVKRIQNYADVMVDYTTTTVDNWHDGEIREMSSEMMRLTLLIVAKTLFDADRSSMADLAERVGLAVHAMQEIVDRDLNSLWVPPDWVPTPHNRRRKEAKRTLDETIDQIIDLRRSQTVDEVAPDRGDLLSMLMLARDEQGAGLSNQDLRDEMVTIFLAGHETTSNALAWSWYALALNPAVEARLHAELDQVLGGRAPTLHDLPNLPYTAQIFKETLRLYPSAWALAGRLANTDTTLGGYAVAKNTIVIASPYVMHRQASLYPDPERFDPDRFTPEREAALPKYAYFPFGGGPHVCIGNSFATMEGQLLLATIAQRFRLELMPEPPVVPNPLITLGMKQGVRMRLVARQPVSAPAMRTPLSHPAVHA